MSLSSRFKQMRKKLNLTQKELADILGTPTQRITDIETGKVKNIKNNEIVILEKKYDINPLWVLTGDGNLFKNDNGMIVGINNGNMTINTSSFNHSQEIKEIISLLKYASPQYLNTIKQKLEQFKKMSEE